MHNPADKYPTRSDSNPVPLSSATVPNEPSGPATYFGVYVFIFIYIFSKVMANFKYCTNIFG